MSKTIQPICRLNHDVERKIIVFKIIIQQDWMDVAIELHDTLPSSMLRSTKWRKFFATSSRKN